MENNMTLCFSAQSQNESFARATAGAFATQLNPTISELADIKTAVSEAVTNAIVHGYDGDASKFVTMRVALCDGVFSVTVTDEGKGIEDISRAREPFYTTVDGDERSGMGFSVMEAFMDSLSVESKVGSGTKVTMSKRIGDAK